MKLEGSIKSESTRYLQVLPIDEIELITLNKYLSYTIFWVEILSFIEYAVHNILLPNLEI